MADRNFGTERVQESRGLVENVESKFAAAGDVDLAVATSAKLP